MLFKKDKKKKNTTAKKISKPVKKAKKVVETPKVEKKKIIKTSMNLSASDNRIYFGALGGMGDKIGCNLYLYGTRGNWIIIDMGIFNFNYFIFI